MKTLSNNEIKNVDGGVDVGGVAIAGVGGFGTGFGIGAGIGSFGGPAGALVGGMIGGMIGTVGGVYAMFEMH
ncbi:bacteriocin-like peptide [Alteromonas sp. S015]|uniref:bacteriocin-like peptide n=1 Tax=Alteromonas sp. S015 TaxID=3117401 RepID=UPI002FE20D3D